MFDTNGKNCSSVLVLVYRQCFNFLNNIVSTLSQFALVFSMVQVFSSYSCKHKKWIQKNIVIKKELYEIRNHVTPTCYLKHVANLFKHWTQCLVSSEHFKILIDCLAKHFKVLATCLKQIPGRVFWSLGNVENFWKSGLQKAFIHTYIHLITTWKS